MIAEFLQHSWLAIGHVVMLPELLTGSIAVTLAIIVQTRWRLARTEFVLNANFLPDLWNVEPAIWAQNFRNLCWTDFRPELPAR